MVCCTMHVCEYEYVISNLLIALTRAAPILVSVSILGQYHHFSVVSESVIQVPSIDSAVKIW